MVGEVGGGVGGGVGRRGWGRSWEGDDYDKNILSEQIELIYDCLASFYHYWKALSHTEAVLERTKSPTQPLTDESALPGFCPSFLFHSVLMLQGSLLPVLPP